MEKSYLKFDEFFKSTTKRFFELLQCNVITEFEIFKLPKKIDIVILKNTQKKFEFFEFFKDYNIISFKSKSDRATIKDIRDLFIYLNGFCNMEKSANFSNTVIVMLTTKIPYNLLKAIKEDLEIYKKGIWKFKVKTFYLYIVEIDKLEGNNIEIEYLYLFGNREKLKEGLLKLKRLKVKEKKLIDFLYKRYYIRYINFEKEIPPEVKMPKVYEADITDLIAPFKEKWKREGLEEGKKEGIKQGELKAKIETAKKMKKKGFSIKDIREITGLRRAQLKKYGII